MIDLLKKPYEISLWDEELVYVYQNGNSYVETTFLSEVGNNEVLNRYIRENKLAVIGSNKLDIPIRAFDAKLTRQLTGANTLTFQIYSKYYDEDYEEYRTNPFINLLVNERKVKLQYDGEWFEFNIKEAQEKSDGNIFTYTCKDSYINELGKSGYDLEFDTELMNNQGTIKELGKRILEGTDWIVDDSSELIQQTNKEALYAFHIPSGKKIEATYLKDFTWKNGVSKKGDTITIEGSAVIYVFYSSYSSKEKKPQILYRPDGNYEFNDEACITNSPNLEFDIEDYIEFYNNSESWLSVGDYFGEKLVSKQLSEYVPEIGKICGLYEKVEVNSEGKEVKVNYYGYSETEYASVAEIQNLLTNGSNFISTNGWVGEGDTNVTLSQVTVKEKFITEDNKELEEDVVYPTLRITPSTSNNFTIKNNGLYSNRAIVKGFASGDSYIFAIRAVHSDKGKLTSHSIVATKGDELPLTLITFNDSDKIEKNSIPTALAGYTVYKGVCNKAISQNDFLDYITDVSISGTGTMELIDARLFRKIEDSNGNILVPDLDTSADSIIKTKYHFFTCDQIKSGNIRSIEDLEFSDVCYETDGVFDDYEPVSSENYEKIRSISGSKSNRFNLIQELCESFECWAKFSIGHDEKGFTKYGYKKAEGEIVAGRTYYEGLVNNPKVDKDFKIAKIETNKDETDEGKEAEEKATLYEKIYDKKVTFKKFIGQDNHVGFRYGINLKSIQRSLNSDQIVSKMIVEPNTNKYAENGSCSIQTAALNPTGENVVYNFDYYVRHKLIDKDALFGDLYGGNGGLNLYGRLRALNDEAAPLIKELVPISATLNTLTSRQLTYKTIFEESKKLYEEALVEIKASAAFKIGETAETIKIRDGLSDYAKDYIIKRDRAATSMASYETMYKNTTTLVDKYNIKYDETNSKLEAITNEKRELNSEFYKRYSHYIQEGSWTSADYIDPELYYLDSQKVSNTSAFPKVTYSINVIEISQVEGFEPYFFRIGDKTYIEDTEFFGWRADGRPYQEEIVVSEVSYSLDDPSKNTIKVQNYKNQFEDLFQRIAATSQSLQYHEGEYKRAASAIEAGGSINGTILQNSMNNNALILKNAKQESVCWDETGITLSNFLNSNDIVRLVSGGILLTNDGGENWTTGITGEGINASVITTGRLDTQMIRIFNSNHQTFEWNGDGINAYYIENAGAVPDRDKYVRFNQEGLFGYDGKKIVFSLTWDGLKFDWTDENSPQISNVTGLEAALTGVNSAIETIESNVGDINNQLDGRIETWYQDEDPSEVWNTDDLKANHVGDLWHYTGETAEVNGIKRVKNSEWLWKESVSNSGVKTYAWTIIEVSDEVFDKIDGKSTIYNALPKDSPKNGDLLIPAEDIKDNTGKVIYEKGRTYYYNNKVWIEIDYTDNASFEAFISQYNSILEEVQEQIDKKAETWYQNEDPSKNWNTDDLKANHVGDLWHDTKNNKTYIYTKEEGKYTWQEADGVPKEVFDKIDKKAQIFTSEPKPPYNVGDLWVQGEDGEILKCITPKGANEQYQKADWVKASKYTDDAKATEAMGLAETVYETADELKKGLGWGTEIGKNYVISPVIGGGQLLIGKKTGVYAEITPEGYLTCTDIKVLGGTISIGKDDNNNPVFSVDKNGHLIAKSGEFYGELKSATGSFSGSLNIGNKFIVDSNGNVTLNGNITWGTHTGTADELYQDFIKDTDTDTWPDYCYSTYIDSTQIYSPTISGEQISVQGFFKTYDPKTKRCTGFIGSANGLTGAGETTNGVAMSAYDTGIDYYTLGIPYIIATTSGARMTVNNIEAGVFAIVDALGPKDAFAVADKTITGSDSPNRIEVIAGRGITLRGDVVFTDGTVTGLNVVFS